MPLSVLLFIAAIGSLVAGGIASAKQRSTAGWAVFGLLFPLIAIVAIACLPERKLLEEAAS